MTSTIASSSRGIILSKTNSPMTPTASPMLQPMRRNSSIAIELADSMHPILPKAAEEGSEFAVT